MGWKEIMCAKAASLQAAVHKVVPPQNNDTIVPPDASTSSHFPLTEPLDESEASDPPAGYLPHLSAPPNSTRPM
eukprot:5740740-Ditylum_brightwellii.AAC.1